MERKQPEAKETWKISDLSPDELVEIANGFAREGNNEASCHVVDMIVETYPERVLNRRTNQKN